jgi:hypothetical protein
MVNIAALDLDQSACLRQAHAFVMTNAEVNALSRVSKGAAAVLQVSGEKNPGIYRDHGAGAHEGAMAH